MLGKKILSYLSTFVMLAALVMLLGTPFARIREGSDLFVEVDKAVSSYVNISQISGGRLLFGHTYLANLGGSELVPIMTIKTNWFAVAVFVLAAFSMLLALVRDGNRFALATGLMMIAAGGLIVLAYYLEPALSLPLLTLEWQNIKFHEHYAPAWGLFTVAGMMGLAGILSLAKLLVRKRYY